jgi:integrase
LTAARSGEVRGALWSEIDLARAVWVIPAARMKAHKDHRVPLSGAAMALLRSLERTGELVFPSPRGQKALSDMSLTAILRRMNLEAVPHGMRSTFRDWVSERTAFPTMLAEMALSHALKDATEAAYARGDLFDKRRALMEAWAGFVDTVAVPVSDNVVTLRRA